MKNTLKTIALAVITTAIVNKLMLKKNAKPNLLIIERGADKDLIHFIGNEE